MNNRLIADFRLANRATSLLALMALMALPVAVRAQVPVDDNGEVIGNVETLSTEAATGNEDIPLLASVDLEELVGPVALYPDDLLAIVLPAAAYPLQIIDAARFLDALEDDPSLEPDPEWDDSVVALTNYPEVIELLNEDIDWTWRLGEAVVSQQADVVAAIETFRDRAYAAGNLKSDSYQNVSRDKGIIEIVPVAEDVIYVPYYEPERVVVYQPRPVYYYYPRPYPVYYYPYPSAYAFDRGFFWGVTTAFTIGWYSDSLNVFHHSYYGHPYYGRAYWDRWWYRRPTINIYNNHYVGGNSTVTVNHYDRGDRWRPRGDRREYLSDRRLTRNRTYPIRRQSDYSGAAAAITHGSRLAPRSSSQVLRSERRPQNREPITFRDRPRDTVIARDQRAQRAEQMTRRGAMPQRQERAPAAARTESTRAQRQSQREQRERPKQRSSGSVNRLVNQRRAEPAAGPGRSQPVYQARRSESARQPRNPQTVAAQTRQSAPATYSTRRAQPSSPARRAQPAAETRRSSSARSATRQSAPRQQESSRKSTPPAEGRKSSVRTSKRRR